MLNTSHPLTDGLQGFWLTVHGRQGGSRLYDLSAYGRHGDLTSMDPATSWVQNVSRLNTVLKFGSENEYTLHPQPLKGIPFTISYSFRTTDNKGGIVGAAGPDFGGYYTGVWNKNNPGEIIQFIDTQWHHTDATFNDGEWHTATVAYPSEDLSTWKIFVDGRERSTQIGNAPSSISPILPDEMVFGLRRPIGSEDFNGLLSDVLLVSGGWGQSEHVAYLNQARRGFTGLLNTRKPTIITDQLQTPTLL
jgi:hypothetical protein